MGLHVDAATLRGSMQQLLVNFESLERLELMESYLL